MPWPTGLIRTPSALWTRPSGSRVGPDVVQVVAPAHQGPPLLRHVVVPVVYLAHLGPARELVVHDLGHDDRFTNAALSIRVAWQIGCRSIKNRPPRDGLFRMERFATFSRLP